MTKGQPFFFLRGKNLKFFPQTVIFFCGEPVRLQVFRDVSAHHNNDEHTGGNTGGNTVGNTVGTGRDENRDPDDTDPDETRQDAELKPCFNSSFYFDDINLFGTYKS
jgi:hypothetical protein